MCKAKSGSWGQPLCNGAGTIFGLGGKVKLFWQESLQTRKPAILKREARFAKTEPRVYGTSISNSRPLKVKLGRRRPFIYFAAVCESAVMMIGRAIVASQLT